MNIYINGEIQALTSNLSIQDLVNQLDLGNKRYALELNQAILPRSLYNETTLNDGDRIEIIHAVGGG
jgi:sulfur carrier protein